MGGARCAMQRGCRTYLQLTEWKSDAFMALCSYLPPCGKRCGLHRTPVRGWKRLPRAPGPDPGSPGSPRAPQPEERPLNWASPDDWECWVNSHQCCWEGASREGQAGLSLVPGPLQGQKGGTAAPGHHWSLLLPHQASAKKRQRGAGTAMPRLKVLHGGGSVAPIPTLPHSASGNMSNLSIFLVSRVVKCSCCRTLLPIHYPWCCRHRPVSVHRTWGRWGGSCLSLRSCSLPFKPWI